MNRVQNYLSLLTILCMTATVMNISCGGEEKVEHTPPPVRSEPEYFYPGNRQIPFQLGKSYDYVYIKEGEEIGKASFRIDKTENNEYSIYSSIDFDSDITDDILKGDSTLIVDENWIPVKYSREIEAQYSMDSSLDGVYTVYIELIDNEMKVESMEPGREEPVIHSVKTTTEVVKDPNILRIDRTFFYDNNCIGLMAYICSQPELRTGRNAMTDIISITYRDRFNLAMTPIIRKEMEYQGQTVFVYMVDMKADGMTFGTYYITPEGIILRAEEEGGFLLIELQNPDW